MSDYAKNVWAKLCLVAIAGVFFLVVDVAIKVAISVTGISELGLCVVFGVLWYVFSD